MTDIDNIDWTEFGGAAGSGDYPERFTFITPGDQITGTITAVSVATMPDGTRLPAIELRDDNGTAWSVLAGPKALQGLLAAHRPASGDRIGIVFTGFGEAKPGKSPAKLFDVAVKRDGDTAAPVAPAAAPAPAPAPSAASIL
jgi:hypothetical protein